MKKPLLIYGAGGLGREVLSLANATGEWEVSGFIDDVAPMNTLVGGIKVLGGLDFLLQSSGMLNVVLAFGSPSVKKEVAGRLSKKEINYPALVHPSVILQDRSSISLSPGCILCAGAVLTTNISLGNHVLVNLNATIGHDTQIGKYSSIMPGVNIAGQVVVGESVLLGSGCNLINKIRIGNDAIVGMGSVVLKDVAGGSTVAGVPARPIRR